MSRSETVLARTLRDVDIYGIWREEANERRGAGWWVSLSRQGQRVVRLFKDSVYSSPDASLAQAEAYRVQ
ncbi:hypothetical protein EV184_102451 [Sinorhizobium americanum]|uniref:Uncharacterized protein n=1 Tax=Sinorhizobium americanum TaxID=194963 RepID=A0A4R2C5K5_9HYPH|nr:hypothetical protein EV184_102451 [Sinorhizobium americanum]